MAGELAGGLVGGLEVVGRYRLLEVGDYQEKKCEGAKKIELVNGSEH